MRVLSFVFLIQGTFVSFRICNGYLQIAVVFTSRENTVLRGQLFERSEADPNVLEVRKSVYVIPSALIPEQFKPCPPPSSDKSVCVYS